MAEEPKQPADITGVNIQISGKAPRLAEDSRDAMKRRERETSFSAAEVGPGVQIGEYVVEAPIAAGAMGEVWRAKHPVIGKHAAIKILGQDIFVNKEAIARFIQEARAVNEIRHRNIIDIFSFGELSDGRPYLVMEFLEGQPLSDYLKEKRVLPFATIVALLDQICRALSAAHERGIVHRDLKPENIFLVIERRAPLFVKLLDFGLAKLLGDQSPGKKELTRPGAVYGTPSYMSPEQCQAAAKADQSSDIYSLGIILFEMICGQVPYPFNEAEGVGMTMVNHMTAPIPKVSELAPSREVPPAVDAFLTRMLAKKKEERPPDCEAVYDGFVAAVGSFKHEEEVRPYTKPEAPPTALSTTGESPIFVEAPTIITSMEHFANTQENPVAQAIQVASLVVAAPVVASEPSPKRGVFLWVGGVAAAALTVGGLMLFSGGEPAPTTIAAAPPASVPLAVEPAPTSSPVEPIVIEIAFSSKPKGAKVFRDKALLGVTPFTASMSSTEEKISLRVEKLGFNEEAIELSPKNTQRVEVELTPTKSTPNKPTNTKNQTKPQDGSKITINPFGKK